MSQVEDSDATVVLSAVTNTVVDSAATVVPSVPAGMDNDATVVSSVSQVMNDDATVVSSMSELADDDATVVLSAGDGSVANSAIAGSTDDATVMFSAMDETIGTQQKTPAVKPPIPPVVPPKIERGSRNEEVTSNPLLKKLLFGIPILIVLAVSPFLYNFFTAQSPESEGDITLGTDTPENVQEDPLKNRPVSNETLPVKVQEIPAVTKVESKETASYSDESATLPTVTNSPITEDPKQETKPLVVKTSLAIQSTPENVQVEVVDHNSSGMTPFKFNGNHGVIQLYFSKTGYQDMSVVVELKEGENLPVHIKMLSL